MKREPHKETAKAAEQVRLTVEFDGIGRIIEELRRAEPVAPLRGGFRGRGFDCGCPLYGTCMNTACPRRTVVTC